MADNEGAGEMVGALFFALLWLSLVVTAVVIAVMALMSIGTVFGAGTALRNYGLAFANNVKPQQVTT